MLFVVYLAYGLSSLFCGNLIKNVNFKFAFFLSAMTYNLFVIFGYLVSNCQEKVGYC